MECLEDGQIKLEGNFPLNPAVIEALPLETKAIYADTCGVSAWATTVKISAILPNNSQKTYFLKCATGTRARPMTEGEHHSACAINEVVPSLVPKASDSQVYFFIGEYHYMDVSVAPKPISLMEKIVALHTKGKSPNGMFGFSVPTALGKFEPCFANQLKDVIRYDNANNGPWPELGLVCQQILERVIPRLLGALQSEGRSIEPVLIHGDLWEQNVGMDLKTGEDILFDPGSTYAHNEMEFGTWRCSWAFHFNSPTYMRIYQRHVEPSEPVDEWDDRNRLYSLHPYLNDSAGHPGSASRATAYNDMLYLCEKYAPLDILESYRPENDISVTGAYIQHSTHIMRDAHLNQIQ
ncbi:hypothetical protein BS50DRAFT_599592 [Corynespora cassiicola Philippines]|uniref:protein-ribulosamine 3-kinase n=1 Tax=Corynespora cassiicola Philippines TaxID=1448308 RepID=A0A2T2NVA2_CORCC|nr:hypothetical protein BS50DRAFT_599592 [Corynespora cassiicola Philippines]